MSQYGTVRSYIAYENPAPTDDSEQVNQMSRKVKASIFFLVSLAMLVGTAVSAQISHSFEPLMADETTLKIRPSLIIDNAYERRTGRAVGDGQYLTQNLAQIHQPTRLRLKNSVDNKLVWEVNGVIVAIDSLEAVVVFTEVGEHVISINQGMYNFTVHAKTIRRELRTLTESDRIAFFTALSTLYHVGQVEGEKVYGGDFKSSDWLVRMHLEGAADIACDHWHDDAGIMNHHVLITWLFEKSMQMIDPSTAAHYWDYTKDAATFGSEWYTTEIFYENWFGSNSPNNDKHVIDTGRWAFTPILKDARAFSNITNPYGLLRSPWNTNPEPYVMRSNKTLGILADNDDTFPTCEEFAGSVGDGLSSIMTAINGYLHGPVHIMIGGHWGYMDKWKFAIENQTYPDNYLLLGKYLWRQGFVRVPEICSADTPHSDCMPYCPEETIGNLTDAELLNNTGLRPHITSDTNWISELKSKNLTLKELVLELCHIGSPGEMFTSAAPQDPTFWPLHGNAERFLQLLRALKRDGTISMDETWGYEHLYNVPSDTGRVCDWSGVTGMERPTCVMETCPGHREDDLLPVYDLLPSGNKFMSNQDFYDYIHPDNSELPYVYDSLAYWPGCTNSSIYDEYLILNGK